MPSTSETFLHVTHSANAAGAIRSGLRLVGREEDVAHFFDDLAVGPLHDVDHGAAARAAWWRRVGATTFPESRLLDDAPIWRRILEDGRKVVLWDGPHPSEHIYAVRGCWFLRQTPSRVHEVQLPANEGADLPAFYGAAGIVGPEGVAAAWPSLRLVPPDEVEARARAWVTLRDAGSEGFREIVDAHIVDLPISAHDEALIDACADGWTSSRLVIARVLATTPTGDFVLASRIRQLVADTRLEGRGGRTNYGLPQEIHVTTALR